MGAGCLDALTSSEAKKSESFSNFCAVSFGQPSLD